MTAGPQLTIATEAAVRLQRRPDLEVRAQDFAGCRYWVVKDPVALKYYHLREEEHAILDMLDGRVTLSELKRRFERLFAPLQIGLERLQAFLAQLHRLGLVIADAEGQGDQLRARRTRRRRFETAVAGLGVLAIRLPGINPERLLTWLYPRCRWLFAVGPLVIAVALATAALVLVGVQFRAVEARLPDFHTFFSAGNAVWLLAAMVAVMVVHELAHAVACRHFGGRCREIGIMLLVFTPVLYCDVSDAWMIANKWKRIAISAAGVAVEVVMAAVCTFLWWFSEPGLFNSLCLNVMFVCSVSTLVFNGNPLLRYDGYYILADLIDTPNLAQQARAAVGRAAGRMLGLPAEDDPRWLSGRHRTLLILYGIASPVYRWVVLLTILWFLHKVLEPYRLDVLAVAVAVVVLAGAAAAPGMAWARRLRQPAWRQRVGRARVVVSTLVLAAVLSAIMLWPMPARVAAPLRLELCGGHRVYAIVPGNLKQSARVGDVVHRGQPLAELENLPLEREVQELTARRDCQQARLRGLQARLTDEPALAAEIVSADEALADVDEQLAQRRRQQELLSLKSPADGVVLPPPAGHRTPYRRGALVEREGRPTDLRNADVPLKTGDVFCLVGDPRRLEAVAVVEQSSLELLRVGQRVRLRLAQLPGEVLEGSVVEMAGTDVKSLPVELAGGDLLPVRLTSDGRPAPAEVSYEVRIALSEQDGRLVLGGRGWAKIDVRPRSLAQRLGRWLQRTFRIDL